VEVRAEYHPMFARQYEQLIRVPYVWFVDTDSGEELAVVMLMGDKTTLGNHWYPRQVQVIETLLIPGWMKHHPNHQARTRRTR
jgi:hypothetical protein